VSPDEAVGLAMFAGAGLALVIAVWLEWSRYHRR
jgi:hypothetical protein